MKKLIMILGSAALLFGGTLSAGAQETFRPGWKLDVMGGANYVTSNNWRFADKFTGTPDHNMELSE